MIADITTGEQVSLEYDHPVDGLNSCPMGLADRLTLATVFRAKHARKSVSSAAKNNDNK